MRDSKTNNETKPTTNFQLPTAAHTKQVNIKRRQQSAVNTEQ